MRGESLLYIYLRYRGFFYNIIIVFFYKMWYTHINICESVCFLSGDVYV